jgi:hypothetical protein
MRWVVRVLHRPGWKPRLYGRQDARRHRRCFPADTAAARSCWRAFGEKAYRFGKSVQYETIEDSMKNWNFRPQLHFPASSGKVAA